MPRPGFVLAFLVAAFFAAARYGVERMHEAPPLTPNPQETAVPATYGQFADASWLTAHDGTPEGRVRQEELWRLAKRFFFAMLGLYAILFGGGWLVLHFFFPNVAREPPSQH